MVQRKGNNDNGRSMKEALQGQLQNATFVSKQEIVSRGPRSTPVARLSVWEDSRLAIEYIKKHGITPFQDALELNITKAKEALSPDDRKKIEKYKSVELTVMSRLRKNIRKEKLESLVGIIRRADRIYLVGLE